MHSSLVGRVGGSWVVEAPDGDHYVLSAVNVVTGGVPAFIGMEGVMVTLEGRWGGYRRFFAHWSAGTPKTAVRTARRRLTLSLTPQDAEVRARCGGSGR